MCTARISERERPASPISALAGATSYRTSRRSLVGRDSPEMILTAGLGQSGPRPYELGDATEHHIGVRGRRSALRPPPQSPLREPVEPRAVVPEDLAFG